MPISLRIFCSILFLFIAPSSGYAFDREEKSSAHKGVDVLRRALTEVFMESAGLDYTESEVEKNDEALERALDRALGELFYSRGESVFTQYVISTPARPVEMRGFVLRGPLPSNLTEADKLNGIESRVVIAFRAKAFRIYQDGKWGKWKPGKPGLLNPLSLQKVHGEWQVRSTPSRYYRLDP